MNGTRGRPYQKTTAGRGSALAQALADNDAKRAREIYNETTARFDAQYPNAQADRLEFENWNCHERAHLPVL